MFCFSDHEINNEKQIKKKAEKNKWKIDKNVFDRCNSQQRIFALYSIMYNVHLGTT